MRGLLETVQVIKDELVNTGLVNNVEVSRPDDFLQNKRNFFPAAHIDYGRATTSDSIITVDVILTLVDVVDEELDNEETVLSNMLDVAGRVQAVLGESQARINHNLDVPSSLTRLYEQGEQNYAGWVMEFPLKMVNRSHNGC